MTAPGNTRRLIRQTLTIARRDFTATVFTPTFLLFLLAPLIMAGFGMIGGLGAATMADSRDRTVRIVAIADPATGQRLAQIDTRLRAVFRESDAPPPLRIDRPQADPATQARALIEDEEVDVSAVLLDRSIAPRSSMARKGRAPRHIWPSLPNRRCAPTHPAGSPPAAMR
jgi:ABC-2 type transport system permease protein